MLKHEKATALAQAASSPNGRFLRPARAAQHASISRSTIYKLLGTGELTSHRLRGCRLIDREELDRFVLSRAS